MESVESVGNFSKTFSPAVIQLKPDNINLIFQVIALDFSCANGWTGLGVRACFSILLLLILKYGFRPVKLAEISSVVILGKTLYSHSASFHPGVYMLWMGASILSGKLDKILGGNLALG